MSSRAPNSTAVGSHAMILAAGLGTRMRPLTLNKPKPLIEVKGKALIDYGMDKLRADGVTNITVNAHYLAEQIEAWAARQPDRRVQVSDERHVILDTGGGIALALPRLGAAPFFVLNSDSFWLDQGRPALSRLREAWDDKAMDCLLLLCPQKQTVGYDGNGDFLVGSDGRLSRGRGAGALAYIGAYLVHPRVFAGIDVEKFSMNLLWDKMMAAGRLYGLAHHGLWLHVGTPEAIALAEAALAEAASTQPGL